MKIALIGATGMVGGPLLAEALDRGHRVTAIVRDTARAPSRTGATFVQGDVTDSAATAALVAGADVAISAWNPKNDDDAGTGMRALVAGVEQSGVTRFLVVGGAGSLLLPHGERVVDQPSFPEAYKVGALRTAAFLDYLRTVTSLDWAMLTPAALMLPGERRGVFRLGGDSFMADDRGESRISLLDYAKAMIDEAEQPRHHRERFSVAY